MRSKLRNSGIILSSSLLALIGGCGGGGSSSPDSRNGTNDAPVATAPAVSTGEGSLMQYKSYTFTTSASDPNLGDSVASCTWDFGDGSDKVTISAAPFSAPPHVFKTPTAANVVTVTPKDSHGLAGTPATRTFVVETAPNPFTLAIVNPPTAAQPVSLGSTATVPFSFTIAYNGPGTVSAANLVFDSGYTGATGAPVVTAGSMDGLTAWTVAMPYPSGSAIGDSYTATAKVSIGDSLGVQSVVVPFPTLTFQTVAANPTPPSIAITAPQAASTQIYALQTATLGFTVTDVGTFPTTVTVDWGDSTPVTTFLMQGAGLATGMAPAAAPTHVYASAGTYPVTVTAVDTQAAGYNTAQPQTRTFQVLANALPTATITTPQASGTLPKLTEIDSVLPSNMGPELTLPPEALFPQAVVIPLNGQLNFNGVVTNSGSGEPVSVKWTFPGGNPGTSTTLNAGSVSFPGVPGKIIAYLVELQAVDIFKRTSSQVGEGASDTPVQALAKQGQKTTAFRKWVIVDGVNSKDFTLNLLYRQLTDNNGAPILTPATLGSHGAGAGMMIFQDGQSNSYQVKSANAATITVPVRGNLPFYLNLPSFDSSDPVAYMMRIPNKADQDPSLEASMPQGSSSFAFVNGNPTLSIVTSQGFAPENSLTAERRLNAYVSGAAAANPLYSNFWMVLGDKPGNTRWFDRLSVPLTDAQAIPSSFETTNSPVGQFSGIPAYQSFAEWPIYLMSMESDYLPYVQGSLNKSTSPTTSAGSSNTLGFKLNYPGYGTASATKSDTYGVVGMQAFRVPASVQDPYDLTTAVPGWNLDSCVSALNPTVLPTGSGSVPEFLSQVIFNDQSSSPAGLQGFQVPYNTVDVERKVVAGQVRNLSNLAKVFSYAEYLWSSVWVRPLVLNNAQLYYGDTDPLGIQTYPFFRRSNPSAWPKYTSVPYIVPDNSTFDLTANGGTLFNAKSPVSTSGTPDSKAVGRFFWTAFTPFYNSANGSIISRTWLADAAGLPPKTFRAPVAGEAVSAMGFLPPQDTIIDKRARDANGALLPPVSSNPTTYGLGGYRVMWFNPTKDKDGNVVPPDFWVVEISGTNVSGQGKTHFMLPSSYPVPSASGSLLGQATSDPILTDARVYLPSETLPGGAPGANDTVAPGYCWFDVPPELRPSSGSAVVTVFGLKSVLNNNPAGAFRPLNRTDWIDAIKTATANINVVTTSGTDLNYVHKIPFNFGWDIVVVNGEATIVAP